MMLTMDTTSQLKNSPAELTTIARSEVRWSVAMHWPTGLLTPCIFIAQTVNSCDRPGVGGGRWQGGGWWGGWWGGDIQGNWKVKRNQTECIQWKRK